MKRRKTHRHISTANMLRSMKSLWRFTSGFGNKARLNVPPLASRWRLSDGTDQKQRAELRMKFGGRCAYCGCELSDKWHADHVEAVRRNISNGYAMDRPENDTASNMVPACIPCNLFKMCSTVEDFRNRIATQVDVTRRASRSYRTAESFGFGSTN